MRSHAKASTAGSTQRQDSGLGRIFRGALAIRGASGGVDGSGAPSIRLAVSATAVLFLAIVVSLAAESRAATVTQPFLSGQFGSPGSGSGQLTNPQGIAVEQGGSGAVYVADTGNARVQKFTASGSFVLMFGKGVNQTTSGNVCTAASGNTCKAGTPGTAAGELQTPRFIAVDSSGGPSNGSVYVADTANNKVTKFDSSGNLVAGWGSGGQLNGSTATNGPFGAIAGIVVDPSGNLEVLDTNSRMFKFTENGTFSTDFTVARGTSANGLTVDSLGNFYKSNGSPSVQRLTPAGADLGQVTFAQDAKGMASNLSSGDLFVNGGARIDRYHFDGSGNVITSTGATCTPTAFTGCEATETFANGGELSGGVGIAVRSSNGDVYGVSSSTGKVIIVSFLTGTAPDVTIEATSEKGVSKAKANGKVNPLSLPASSYKFEWKQGAGASWSGAQASAPVVLPVATEEIAVSHNIAGLLGNTTYQVRLVGINDENGLRSVSSADTFTTATAASAPAVTIVAPAVNAATANVSGTVNPKEDFGTTWRLQVSTDPACAGGFSAQPSHNLSSEANSPLAVSEELTGLQANQHYCVRIAATNSAGTTTSEVKEFTTDPVIPSQVFTAFAAPRTDTTARINARVNPEGASSVYPMTYRFEYSKDGGTTWIALPEREYTEGAREQIVLAEELTGLSPNTTYSYRFSAESDAGPALPQGEELEFTTRTTAEMILPPRGFELVSNPDKGNQRVEMAELPDKGSPMSADGEKVVWSVNGGAPGGASGTGATFLAERTASGWKSTGLVPPAAAQIGGGNYKYTLQATNPDFSQFFYTVALGKVGTLVNDPTVVRLDDSGHQDVLKNLQASEFALAGNIEVTDDGSHVLVQDPVTGQLEDVGSGSPEPVSVMPDGLPAECGTIGNDLRHKQWKPDYHVASVDDASRVYFQASPNGNCSGLDGLYLRNRDTEETTLIDPGAFGENPEVIRATPDGQVVYFASFSQLDPADGNVHRDVYRWDEASGEPTCLTCEAHPDVNIKEQVLISDDFSHIYFESTHQLVPGMGKAGHRTIYTLSEGEVRFVADIGADDTSDVFNNDPKLSSDGNVLLFQANTIGLTADHIGPECVLIQNGEEAGLSGCKELYRYDDWDGSVECISCDRSGPTTHGVGVENLAGLFRYQLSADGNTIPFVTWEPLVPLDVNHDADIYEWRNGAVRLLTDGISDQGVLFSSLKIVAIDRNGANILVALAPPNGKLTGFEQDGLLALYDVRIGGGFEPPSPVVHCSEDSCQGPLQAAPTRRLPASAGFSGRGNEVPQASKKRRPCARKHGKVKRRCIRKHKRQAQKASVQGNGGRAK